MARTAIGERNLTAAERTKRADEAKRKEGQIRVSAWISADGAKAMAKLRRSGDSDRTIINDAILLLASMTKAQRKAWFKAGKDDPEDQTLSE